MKASMSRHFSDQLAKLGITNLVRMNVSPLEAEKILIRLENTADIFDASSFEKEDLAKLAQTVHLEHLVYTLKQQANLNQNAGDDRKLEFKYEIVEMSASGMVPLWEIQQRQANF